MKFYLFLLTLISITIFSSCKKKQAAEIDPGTNCLNITQTINDSLLVLLTTQNAAGYTIIKTQYGTSTTVASQTGFEFWSPSISPDKTKFICFRSPTSNSVDFNDFGAAELWLFNVDGSNGHLLTTLTSQSLTGMGMGKWAPDGLHIVFAGEKNETDGNLHWNIYLTDTLGTLATKMNTRLGDFKDPCFANGDMTKLVYEAWNVGITLAGSVYDTEVHVATVNGSYQFTSESKITNNNYLEHSPSFSSDNISISYSQNTSLAANTAIEIYTAVVSSGTTTKILSNNNINENPVWCPTNNKIYFLNKTGSACFETGNRINPDGTSNAITYQLMNASYLQLDLK